jgi:hypothetical protein
LLVVVLEALALVLAAVLGEQLSHQELLPQQPLTL